MNNQQDFLQTILELKELALTKGGRLSPDEIRGAFPDMDLTDDHMTFISSYLAGYHILVEDFQGGEAAWEPETQEEDPRDQRLADLYLEESAHSATLTGQEINDLLDSLAAGQEEARDILVEARLSLAADLAGDYRNRGLPYSDLIQESNLGLLLAVSDYRPGSEESFDSFLERRIRRQLEDALRDYNASSRPGVKMADQINRLNEISSAFARDHDREARVDELADRMGIPEEEVRTLMKASLDAVNLLEH